MARLARIEREEWLSCFWDAEPGEHVAFFEPTQQGKTHLMYQMLDKTMDRHPGLRTVSLMPKSRDPATRRWAERLGLKVIDQWPPPARFPGQERPRGYVLWPRHPKGDLKRRREYLAGILRRALSDQFEHGNSITVMDDMYLGAVLLGLNPECEELLTAGAGGGASLWLTSQKPSGTRDGGSLTSFAYNSPTHIVLGHDPMPENRKRFSDIGGVDAGMVADVVARLPKHRVSTPAGYKNISEKLYIRKDGPYMNLIGI